MSYIAQTVLQNIVNKVTKARQEPSINHKMIIMFPSMPEKVTLLISEILTNHFLTEKSLILTLKVANILTKDWDESGQQKAEKNGWIDTRDSLVYYRGIDAVLDKFSLVILIGVDRVTDASSLSDFDTCEPDLIWKIDMKQSFRSWIEDKLQKGGIHDYEDEDLNVFDRILKPILNSGHGDLFQISEWLYNLDINGIDDTEEMQRHILGNLQKFSLPLISRFPLKNKKRDISLYFNKSKDFFKYSLFIETLQRDKAIKAIDTIIQSLSDGETINIPIEDEDVKGPYSTGEDFLNGLKNYITNNNQDDHDNLFRCDFVIIWDDILKFKRSVKISPKETISKLSGNPTEVFLTAIWKTLRSFYEDLNVNDENSISEIYLVTDNFKHDINEGENNIAENTQLAIEYLTRLIGGIDCIFKKYINLSNPDGTEIKVISELLNSDFHCRNCKSAEPLLEFSIRIVSKDTSLEIKRKFGWRLPEHHMYRLSADLLLWAKSGFENLNKDFHVLPVFHVPYYEELMQSSSDDEIRRILLQSLRDESENRERITNLLSGEWSKVVEPIALMLKTLADKYYEFIDNSVNQGILSAIFENNEKWIELKQFYIGIFETIRATPNSLSSSMLGMLTRCFLIIQPRSVASRDGWHADHFERSGITTILHPSVIEMLEAQIVYLTRCFNYAINKELRANSTSNSFNPIIWETYVNLSEIQSPLTGLLYNENKNLDTNVRGNELIHRIGIPLNSEAPLSTRLIMNYQEDSDDENELTDTELFRMNSESTLLLRLLLEYFDLHPHARDGLSIAVYRNKSLQPVLAAVNYYLKELAKPPTAQQSNKRYILNNDRQTPYSITVTLITESYDEAGVSILVKQWKDRWDSAETEQKYNLYRYCRFSIAHRIINKSDLASFLRLTNEHFEADITVLYDFIGAGEGGNKFEAVDEFDVLSRELKFPILEKASCTINTIAEKFRRKRIISNRQFLLGDLHANLLHSLQKESIQTGTIVVGIGDFEPWRLLIDNLHKKSDWVICVDPNMDERLIKSNILNLTHEREIIGFGSGVGVHGEDNFTISTEQYTLVNILNSLKASINSLYAHKANWSTEDCNYIAKGILKESSKLSGLSLVRATGVGDEYIRDFMAYALSRKMLLSNEDALFESLVSLDAYRHWFDLSENKSRPDLLWISVILNGDKQLEIKMQLVECKMGLESSEHLIKAKSQIDNGLLVLIDAFKPIEKLSDSNLIENDRPDRRYWWMQLHRLIASKTEVDNIHIQYKTVLTALERLSNGDFKISWQASVFAFWQNDSKEIKRVSYWKAFESPLIIGNIYTIGGGFVKQLMTNPEIIIDWKQLDTQGSELEPEDIIEVGPYEDEDVTPWEDETTVDEGSMDTPTYSDEDLIDLSPNMNSSGVDTYSLVDEIIPAITLDSIIEPENEVGVPSEVEESDTISVADCRILLGHSIQGNHPVYWEFGHKELANRHMLIFGSPGQGKTYAIQCILCEMIRFKQHSLIIDYTNGFLPHQLEAITNEKLAPKQHVIRNEPLPINPFLPIDSDNGGIQINENSNSIAKRITGIFDTVYNIGDQQFSVLYNAIMEGVNSLGENMSLKNMLEIIEDKTSDRRYKTAAQSLITKLQPFVLDKPFSYGGENLDWDSIFLNEVPLCNIFQLTGLDLHSSRLITEFILWNLYAHLQAKGKKSDPKVIVLDEVQNLDHKEGNPLSKYLREGRKFGVSLILATQTIGNLKKDEISRMFMAEHKLFFKPSDTELRSFADIAAQSTKLTRDEWINKLSELKKGECYSIGPALDLTGEKLITRAYKIKITSLEERNFDIN